MTVCIDTTISSTDPALWGATCPSVHLWEANPYTYLQTPNSFFPLHRLSTKISVSLGLASRLTTTANEQWQAAFHPGSPCDWPVPPSPGTSSSSTQRSLSLEDGSSRSWNQSHIWTTPSAGTRWMLMRRRSMEMRMRLVRIVIRARLVWKCEMDQVITHGTVHINICIPELHG